MYYTGYTKNLYKRWSQHRSGRGAKFCRGKDIELKYFETFRDQGDAMRRELEIKSYSRDQKKELIESIGGGFEES